MGGGPQSTGHEVAVSDGSQFPLPQVISSHLPY